MGQGPSLQNSQTHVTYDTQGRRMFVVARAVARDRYSGAEIVVYRSQDAAGKVHDPGCDTIKINTAYGPSKAEAEAAHGRLKRGLDPDGTLWSFTIDMAWLQVLAQDPPGH